jgi:hypothetical protein
MGIPRQLSLKIILSRRSWCCTYIILPYSSPCSRKLSIGAFIWVIVFVLVVLVPSESWRIIMSTTLPHTKSSVDLEYNKKKSAHNLPQNSKVFIVLGIYNFGIVSKLKWHYLRSVIFILFFCLVFVTWFWILTTIKKEKSWCHVATIKRYYRQ